MSSEFLLRLLYLLFLSDHTSIFCSSLVELPISRRQELNMHFTVLLSFPTDLNRISEKSNIFFSGIFDCQLFQCVPVILPISCSTVAVLYKLYSCSTVAVQLQYSCSTVALQLQYSCSALHRVYFLLPLRQ